MDLYGISALAIATAIGCHLDSARRWKRAGKVPGAAAVLLELRLDGELGLIHPAWSGWRLVRGQLWTPHGWRVEPGEILALPYRYQQLRALERLLAAARATSVQNFREKKIA